MLLCSTKRTCLNVDDVIVRKGDLDVLVCMYWCMTTSMYCLYVGVDYTYIDVNALAQGIKSVLASHVWFQAVAGARTYGTDSPAITISHANQSATETSICMYVCMYVCIDVWLHLCIVCMSGLTIHT